MSMEFLLEANYSQHGISLIRRCGYFFFSLYVLVQLLFEGSIYLKIYGIINITSTVQFTIQLGSPNEYPEIRSQTTTKSKLLPTLPPYLNAASCRATHHSLPPYLNAASCRATHPVVAFLSWTSAPPFSTNSLMASAQPFRAASCSVEKKKKGLQDILPQLETLHVREDMTESEWLPAVRLKHSVPVQYTSLAATIFLKRERMQPLRCY